MKINMFVEQEQAVMPITQKHVDQGRQCPNIGGIYLDLNAVEIM